VSPKVAANARKKRPAAPPEAAAPAPRAPLHRDRVIDAAVRLVDRDGPEELSMRKLAAELGVEAMSLYNHVPNKAAVLDGVAEAVLAKIDLRAGARGGWEDRIRAMARAFRTVALAHPRSFPLVLTRQLGSVTGLRPIEASLQVMHAAGFDRATSVHALRAFVAFQTGSLLRELGASPSLSGLSPEGVTARREELARSDFPAVAAAAAELAACRHDAEYDFGIELLLSALRQMRKGAKRATRKAR
jgi:AcrR family transcriptional regulator